MASVTAWKHSSSRAKNNAPGTSTTRTTSSYFSPNMAVAPAALASARPITLVNVGDAPATHPLTRASIWDSSAPVSGRDRL